MIAERFDIDGPLLLKPRIFKDDRGRFQETWNQAAFNSIVPGVSFVQDNESISAKHVLRGLHLQAVPFAQGKLVRVAHGSALDACVDVRPGSPTYGRHIKVLLDDSESACFWIPPGFAHGFVALQDHTIFQYKCTAQYQPAAERTILWNDPDLGIDWGVTAPIISPKDRLGLPFSSAWDAPIPAP